MKNNIALNDIQMAEILWLLLNTKLTQQSIALIYATSYDNISDIKTGRCKQKIYPKKPIWLYH